MNENNENNENNNTILNSMKIFIKKAIFELPFDKFKDSNEAKEQYILRSKLSNKYKLLEKLIQFKPELLRTNDLEKLNRINSNLNFILIPVFSSVLISAFTIPYFIIQNNYKMIKIFSIIMIFSLIGLKYSYSNYRSQKYKILNKYYDLIDLEELRSMKSEGK